MVRTAAAKALMTVASDSADTSGWYLISDQRLAVARHIAVVINSRLPAASKPRLSTLFVNAIVPQKYHMQDLS